MEFQSALRKSVHGKSSFNLYHSVTVDGCQTIVKGHTTMRIRRRNTNTTNHAQTDTSTHVNVWKWRLLALQWPFYYQESVPMLSSRIISELLKSWFKLCCRPSRSSQPRTPPSFRKLASKPWIKASAITGCCPAKNPIAKDFRNLSRRSAVQIKVEAKKS